MNVKTKLSDRLRPLLLGAALLAATAQADVRPLDPETLRLALRTWQNRSTP